MASNGVAYRLTGGGRVTVFITQSLGFASAEWWPIQDELSAHARVLTWDRPGYGESGPPLSPRTVGNVAAEALELLARVAPDGPLVVVGHSQGGLYTNAIARLAGHRVAGVVLLDPAHPDNSRLRRELPAKLFRGSGSDLSGRMRVARTMARLRLIGALKPLMRRQPPFTYCSQHSREAVDAMWRHLTRAQAYDAALAEYEELEYRTSTAALEALGPFPLVPLAVLVHDPAVMIEFFVRYGHLPRTAGERVETLWGELLRDHGRLSPLAQVETVVGSGHLIHLEQPHTTLSRIVTAIDSQRGC
ncbi:MAG TPA: alpha/beta hydrolase [Candidatus Dormibacteraeota bacterium]|nr:alpha/beta hydrolase [Candidatus Dormibacteraeota bacterium]